MTKIILTEKYDTSISIITATRNASKTIADCLQSIISQTIPVEHIVVDGNSSDDTLKLVRELSPDSRISSEPDAGIYDAMNKGIALATGEVIGILNADDFYPSPNVLSTILKSFEDPDVMSCYGDLEYISEVDSVNGVNCNRDKIQNSHSHNRFKIVRYWKSGFFSPSKFYWGWMPPHPTFFVRRSVYEKYGVFRLDLGSAADYEMMLRLLLKNRITTRYIPAVLVQMRTGGVSNSNVLARLAANRMDRKAWEVNQLIPYPWTMVCKPLRKVTQWCVVKTIRVV